MKTSIRKMFHLIGNKHNGVSIISGYLGELLKDCSLKSNSVVGKEIILQLESGLIDLEKNIMDADKSCEKLKKYLYSVLNPDKDIDIK